VAFDHGALETGVDSKERERILVSHFAHLHANDLAGGLQARYGEEVSGR
jgi:hypothetical protein